MSDTHKNLFFVGIKHSGKTTFARMVGENTKRCYEDADNLILHSIQEESVRDFYKKEGKERFMEKELECVSSFIYSSPSPFILSLGGGASDNTPLMKKLKESGTIVYLRREEKDLLPVILKHGIPPFLDENDISGSFHSLFLTRDGIYRNYADIIINLGQYQDKEKTLSHILNTLKESGHVS